MLKPSDPSTVQTGVGTVSILSCYDYDDDADGLESDAALERWIRIRHNDVHVLSHTIRFIPVFWQ